MFLVCLEGLGVWSCLMDRFLLFEHWGRLITLKCWVFVFCQRSLLTSARYLQLDYCRLPILYRVTSGIGFVHMRLSHVFDRTYARIGEVVVIRQWCKGHFPLMFNRD